MRRSPQFLLVLLRHADAGAARKSASADSARPLSVAGKRAALARARELKRRVAAFDLIVTSPLRRATQTAIIAARAYRQTPMTLPALAPAQPRARLLRHLRRQRAAFVLLVGHEPELSELASWLLARRRHTFIQLTKGGCCALALRRWRGGSATLLWLLD